MIGETGLLQEGPGQRVNVAVYRLPYLSLLFHLVECSRLEDDPCVETFRVISSRILLTLSEFFPAERQHARLSNGPICRRSRSKYLAVKVVASAFEKNQT